MQLRPSTQQSSEVWHHTDWQSPTSEETCCLWLQCRTLLKHSTVL